MAFLNSKFKLRPRFVFRLKLVIILILVILLTTCFIFLSNLKSSSEKKVIFFGIERFETNEIKNILVLAIVSLVLSITALIVISLNEYKHLIFRKINPYHTNTYLTFNDVFENEYRKKIINKILEEPGIHNNELLRQCNLQNGQLQWHLNVLLRYKIIKQKKVGQYNTFYPIITLAENSKEEQDFFFKSKTTLKILDIIEKNPGITSSTIAKQLKLARSTLKYHIDKLSKEDFISLHWNGRKLNLYSREFVENS